MRELLAELRNVLDGKQPCVYCSLIETRGSTPQKAGAAMLVFPDGSQKGTLGGGCVEAEVKQQALKALAGSDGEAARVLTFNLDDNYGWDDGLICGGRMSILATSLNSRGAAPRYYQQMQQLIEQGSGCTEAVVMKNESNQLNVGDRFLFDKENRVIDRLAVNEPTEALIASLKTITSRPKAYVAGGAAYLPHWPRITLLIVGGGHVGHAVARLAADVDFDIWVADDRELYTSAERFPSASQRFTADIGETLKNLAREHINASTFCLIVTRGHNHDEEALYHLAESSAGYVGMIGSKRKIKLIYEDLLARGISKESLNRVHAPLGFAIGSQSVAEIAVSIVAELIAVRNLGHSIPEARIHVEV